MVVKSFTRPSVDAIEQSISMDVVFANGVGTIHLGENSCHPGIQIQEVTGFLTAANGGNHMTGAGIPVLILSGAGIDGCQQVVEVISVLGHLRAFLGTNPVPVGIVGEGLPGTVYNLVALVVGEGIVHKVQPR